MLLAPPGPPVTEVVPVRIHGHDSSWPPVLIVCVLVVVVGGLVAALVFLRRARRPPDRPGNRSMAEPGAGSWLDPARVAAGDVLRAGWEQVVHFANIGPRSRRARRFRRFGDGSAICFPVAALYGEEYIEVGGGLHHRAVLVRCRRA